MSNPMVLLETSSGDILIELYADKAPGTVANFLQYVDDGFYKNTVFHRVIKDFMIQGGDPTGTGRGGPGYSFRDEFDPKLKHDKPGMLSMANAGPNTNGSQFFIMLADNDSLPKNYTIFGKVTKGMDVVKKIVVGDKMTTVEVK